MGQVGLDDRGPFGHTGVARHRYPPGGMGEMQLPIRCLTEGCLVTSLMMSYRHFSKTYCRKGRGAREAWSQRALETAPGWGAVHGYSTCGGRGDAVAIRPMAAVLGSNGSPGQR